MIRLTDANYWAIVYAENLLFCRRSGFYLPTEGVTQDPVFDLDLKDPKALPLLEEYSNRTTREALIKHKINYRDMFDKAEQVFVTHTVEAKVHGICYALAKHCFYPTGMLVRITDSLSLFYMAAIKEDAKGMIDPRIKKGAFWFDLGDLTSRIMVCAKLKKLVCPSCGTLTNHFPYCPTL